MLRDHGIRDHESAPMWGFLCSSFEGKEHVGFSVLFVLFFTPEAEPSVSTTIPLEVSLCVIPVVHVCHVSELLNQMLYPL